LLQFAVSPNATSNPASMRHWRKPVTGTIADQASAFAWPPPAHTETQF
jgi:hypothetical protein